MAQPITSGAPETSGKIRGSGTSRNDPPPTSLDGSGNKTDVDGKDPNYHYCWLHPQHLKLQLNPWMVPDGKHAGHVCAGFARCKRSEETAVWAGFSSVRDGSSFNEEDICNGELVLFKKPMRDYLIEQEYHEEQALMNERQEIDEGDGRTLRSNLQFSRSVGAPSGPTKTF